MTTREEANIDMIALLMAALLEAFIFSMSACLQSSDFYCCMFTYCWPAPTYNTDVIPLRMFKVLGKVALLVFFLNLTMCECIILTNWTLNLNTAHKPASPPESTITAVIKPERVIPEDQ